VAVGKPVIATPYVHAREILADDHGVLVAPADAAALAEATIELLENDAKRQAIGNAAYQRGRSMVWPHVVGQSLARMPVPRLIASHAQMPRTGVLPLNAIDRMSDAVGMMQHAVYSIPDRKHGYCIDDNARALMAMVRRGDDRQAASLAMTYAAFIQHGWNPATHRFRNFLGFDRQWLEECGSEDCNGRTIWALGLTAARAPWPSAREWSLKLFEEAAPLALELEAPRALAFAALGGHELLRRYPSIELARTLLHRSSDQLTQLHGRHARDDWNWFEPWLAYDNARPAEALIRAGETLDRPAHVKLGLSMLVWLVARQTSPRGTFRPVGCKGFGRSYSPPLAFDQQPIEATATIDAAAAAFAVTGDRKWHRVALDAFGWFFGDNDAGMPLADAADGSCCDGLMATGINRNQGAESILSLHLAAQTMREAFSDLKQAGQERSSDAETRSFAAS
jgi:hypothetical protein